MNELLAQSNHDEIGALLPWYVNGTLREEERDLVRRHLAVCQDCRHDVDMIERVQTDLRRESTVPIVPEAPVPEFLSRLDSAGIASGRRTRQWAMAAAISALALISTAFVVERFWTSNQVFETATSTNTPAAMNYVLTLHFTDETNSRDRDRVFTEISAREIATSDQDNVYEVLVQIDATTLQDVQRYTDQIATRPEISAVEITAVHLPMRNDP